MRIQVVYQIGSATQIDEFTCQKASRQLLAEGFMIRFRKGPGIDQDGNKLISAHYGNQIVYTYED
jgi:hypothetical protein